MIKQLFIYWDQGFENSPKLVQKCLLTWKKHNPTWNIIELDNSNLSQYIDLKQELPENISITQAALSDVIRICLLEKYGGLWIDATTYCAKPLDDWLPQYITSGFFAFNKNSQKTIIGNLFVLLGYFYLHDSRQIMRLVFHSFTIEAFKIFVDGSFKIVEPNLEKFFG